MASTERIGQEASETPVAQEIHTVTFSPKTIRDAFSMYDEDDPHRLWVEAASDAQLAGIAEDAYSSDVLWRVFHDVLELAIDEASHAG